jgi:hypothetical protein
MNTTQTFAPDTFDRMTEDEGWLGWGYLGERARHEDAAYVQELDAQILRWVETLGWSLEDLFMWANSKDGRWFADLTFGGSRSDRDRAFDYVRRQR